jgi:SPP1 gp7 family putative phage head morphogenesis protein
LRGLADFDGRFEPVPSAIYTDFFDHIYKNQTTDLHEGLYNAYYTRLSKAAQTGIGKLWTEADDSAEFARFQKVQTNLSRFAAFRVHHLGEQLRAELHDVAGQKLSRDDFMKKANDLNRRYKAWFETEAQTAEARANIIAKWGDYERRAYLYPNLRYVTAKDERVRDSHRVLHGIVRPLNDAFWKKYTPPVGYRCRCIVQQVDDAVTDLPDNLNEVQIPKGFDENPYFTGNLYTDRHPYFAKVTDPSVKERIEQNVHQIWLKKDDYFQMHRREVLEKGIEGLGIDADEAASLRFYTADVEKVTNLYKTGNMLASNRDVNIWAAIVATLHRALEKIQTVFVGTVRRGDKFDPKMIAAIRTAFERGDVWRSGTFLSSSKGDGWRKFNAGVIFEIYSKKGKYIESLSLYKDEAEVLFNDNNAFKVLEFKENGSRVRIKLQEVD